MTDEPQHAQQRQARLSDAGLIEFLLARIAEDESEIVGVIPPGQVLYDYEVKWQPPRIAHECEAKRRIIERHGDGGDCFDCTPTRYPCPTLRLVAAIYADHPDYREEWKP